MVVVCTVLVIVWSAIELVRNTSLFNLLFLFYPYVKPVCLHRQLLRRHRILVVSGHIVNVTGHVVCEHFVCSLLLYLSLFGFTMEPRAHRMRFQPPRGFMEHREGHKIPPRIFHPFVRSFSPSPSQTLGPMTIFTRQISASSISNTSESSEQTGLGEQETATAYFIRTPPPETHKYSWEYALLLQVGPDDVRREVEVLISDLIVRLKQLLFNSLFCAYYVGFIPMQFADVSVWELGYDSLMTWVYGNRGMTVW